MTAHEDKSIRLCKDCRWSRRDWLLGWEFAKCRAPENAIVDAVTGKTRYKTQYCSVIREFGGCSENGAWFKAKGRNAL